MENYTSSSPHWWSNDTIAVVTGANKGVGYEIVRLLAEQGLTVVLTARDPGRGQSALDALKKGGLESVWFHELDVQSSESIKTLATWLKSKFGGIDILVSITDWRPRCYDRADKFQVNNAGIAFGPTGDSIDYENAEAIIDTNYFGVKRVTQELMPLLRPSPAGARIISLTSERGQYQDLRSETLKEKFRDEDKYTEELFDSLAKKYLEDVKANRWDEEGWVGGKKAPMYSVSKILLNAYTIFLARSLSKLQPEDHQMYVATFTPGMTMTDMMLRAEKEGYPFPPNARGNTPAQGADTGVWLALLSKEELAERHGKFFKNRTEYSFGQEKVL